MKMCINFFIGCFDVEVFYNEFFWVNVLCLDVVLGKKGIIVFVGYIYVGVCFYWKYKYMVIYVLFFVNDGGWVDVEVRN